MREPSLFLVRHCPVCDGVDIQEALSCFDDRFGYPGSTLYYHCRYCDHLFADGKLTSEVRNDLYNHYYPRATFAPADYHPFKEIVGLLGKLQAWLNGENRYAFRYVPSGVKVLDIGCGYGEALGYHAQRDCHSIGVEIDEAVQKVASEWGFTVHSGEFVKGMFQPGSFDYVTLDQVLEHCDDPGDLLASVHDILTDNGVVVISSPTASGWGPALFGRKWLHWHAPYHRQFFSPKSMSIMVKRFGFRIECIKHVTASDWLYWQWLHLLSYPERGIPSTYWKKGKMPSLGQKCIERILCLFHYLRINHMLTRCADLMGKGDNLVFLLRRE